MTAEAPKEQVYHNCLRRIADGLYTKTGAQIAAAHALSTAHETTSWCLNAERVVALEAEVSTLRESLAEVNRLLSLNVAEVERLQRHETPVRRTAGGVKIVGECQHDADPETCPACADSPEKTPADDSLSALREAP